MKILLVSSNDPKNIRSWSGTTKNILLALDNFADDLALFHSTPYFMRFFSRIFSFASRRNSDFYKTKVYSKFLARRVKEIIEIEKPDIIIGVAATVELAYVKTNIPIIHISDATYMNLHNYYDKYMSVWDWSKKSADYLEQRVIDNANVVVLPTQWASQSAIDDYNCPQQKIHTIPFGANFPGDIKEPEKRIVGLDKPCKLLFVGVNWKRKGGDIVFNAMQALRSKGIDAELQVIGCIPPANISSPHMSVKRFLNKQDPDQCQELVEYYTNSTFLIVPTLAEAFGIVFAEAAMFGLPSISHHTGGVTSVIDHEKTGYLLPIGSSGEDFANVIEDIISDNDKYQEMARNTYNKYQTQLNWKAWQHNLEEIIDQILVHGELQKKTIPSEAKLQ